MSQAVIAEYTIGLFQPLLGQEFRIGEGENAIPAALIDVANLREAQGAGRLSRQFSLIWRGPRQALLSQGIHPVRHPTLGALELFLVCIGPDAEGMRYEAVFT